MVIFYKFNKQEYQFLVFIFYAPNKQNGSLPVKSQGGEPLQSTTKLSGSISATSTFFMRRYRIIDSIMILLFHPYSCRVMRILWIVIFPMAFFVIIKTIRSYTLLRYPHNRTTAYRTSSLRWPRNRSWSLPAPAWVLVWAEQTGKNQYGNPK